MPATAGRVRMPANNRVHSSAALQTHGIWQSAIGYDPYAPDQKQAPPAAPGGDRDAQISAPSSDQQNAYDSFQGLLALARLTGSNADEARGACRKCGRVGHLPFQCRNFLVLKDELAAASAAAAASANLGGYPDGGNGSSHRKNRTHGKQQREGGLSTSAVSDLSSEEDESSETDESGLSDSSEDSEMERAIAAKLGKNVLNSLRKKSKSAHGKEQSKRKRSHSKRSKGRKGVSSEDTPSSEEDLKRAKQRSKSSKRSHKEVEDSGTEEEASESESEREHRRKRKRHSHKHSKSRSKHRSKQLDEASEGRRKKRLTKKGSSRQHGDRKHE